MPLSLYSKGEGRVRVLRRVPTLSHKRDRLRDPLHTAFARDSRHRQTDAERNLWMRLRDRQLGQVKFRRQYPIGPYIVDFCCIKSRLIVELDGGHHADTVEADEQRTDYLKRQGFRVVRFWDNDVLNNMDGVLEAILEQLQSPQ